MIVDKVFVNLKVYCKKLQLVVNDYQKLIMDCKKLVKVNNVLFLVLSLSMYSYSELELLLSLLYLIYSESSDNSSLVLMYSYSNDMDMSLVMLSLSMFSYSYSVNIDSSLMMNYGDMFLIMIGGIVFFIDGYSMVMGNN